jgi:hypothetical protein
MDSSAGRINAATAAVAAATVTASARMAAGSPGAALEMVPDSQDAADLAGPEASEAIRIRRGRAVVAKNDRDKEHQCAPQS